jgi:hypothetical protein
VEDNNTGSGNTVAVVEHERKWPGAAARVGGRIYLPTVSELLKAYAWRIGGESVPDPGVHGTGDAYIREMLADLLFPTPWRAETEYEFRCLLAKVQVGDGLWSSFRIGAPFSEYRTADGASVYSDAQAVDLGRMFEDAHNSLGVVRLYTIASDLARTLIMPG